MKLVPRAAPTSFYETFSDLIFCTLVLFILLVMAMVVQTRERVSSALVENMFIGSSDDTRVFIGLTPVDGQTHVAWIPSPVANSSLLIRGPDNDVLLRLCELAVEGRLETTPAGVLVEMAGGVSPELARSFVTLAELGSAVHVIRVAREREPEIAADAAALRRAIAGAHTSLGPSTVTPAYREAYEEWSRWARGDGGAAAGVHARQAETVAPLLERARGEAPPDPDGRPRLRVGVRGEGVVAIGEAALSSSAFRAMLGAVDAGRGFRVEYIAKDGQPRHPPAWLLDDALTPAGFDIPLPDLVRNR